MSLDNPPGRGSARMSFDRNLHPATQLELLAPQAEATCGSCAHLYVRPSAGGGTTLNCRQKKSKTRKGANLQPTFPACTAFDRATP